MCIICLREERTLASIAATKPPEGNSDHAFETTVFRSGRNRSHYLQTTGVPRLLELLAEKLRTSNGIPIQSDDELMVTTGGIHGLYIICQALLEPGDEVIIPDPE